MALIKPYLHGPKGDGKEMSLRPDRWE